jgi:hypothetical protein
MYSDYVDTQMSVTLQHFHSDILHTVITISQQLSVHVTVLLQHKSCTYTQSQHTPHSSNNAVQEQK